jgi:hypothetical protein
LTPSREDSHECVAKERRVQRSELLYEDRIDKVFYAPAPATGAVTSGVCVNLVRDEYAAYLRRQRGLAESTIAHCTRFLERFVAFRFGDKLGDLNADHAGRYHRFPV